MSNYTFGPVSSRRFGVSLGIDLSPDEKCCNFDCLYCELPKANKKNTITNPPKVENIIKDVKRALASHPNSEVITITANGEPTLYPYLNELIDELLKIKKDKKLLILSNSSKLHEKSVKDALLKLDMVKLSLDCVTNKCFKKIDRPLEVSINKIIESVIDFKKAFKGELIIEILLVSGINDNILEFEKFKNILKEIAPNRIDIGTIDRPPAYDVKPVSYEKIELLSQTLKGLPVNIVTKKTNIPSKSFYSRDEILSTLDKRPFREDDILALFDDKSIALLNNLVSEEIVEIITTNDKKFLRVKK